MGWAVVSRSQTLSPPVKESGYARLAGLRVSVHQLTAVADRTCVFYTLWYFILLHAASLASQPHAEGL